jgi:hypothetical protein
MKPIPLRRQPDANRNMKGILRGSASWRGEPGKASSHLATRSLIDPDFGIGRLASAMHANCGVINAARVPTTFDVRVSQCLKPVQPDVKYAQPPHLFRNLGRNKFEEWSGQTQAIASASDIDVVRGAAYGDFDSDGDLDLLITANNGRARSLRNDNGNQNDMLPVTIEPRWHRREGHAQDRQRNAPV